jgi:UDP-N-acetylmuramoylalanine--D-glutamate ligase
MIRITILQQYTGLKVLVMGLGLHGGGLESARYLAAHGAEVTVTDLRDEAALSPSIEKLDAGGVKVRYVLGRHDIEDFKRADMVIKGPGVPPDSPYLKAAGRIETDISLFLAASPARLTAVTGSKGKSGTASALHWALDRARSGGLLAGRAFLGGNITVSPLTFLDCLDPDDDVVLELSSWQLGDLRGKEPLLKPRAAVLTAVMPDHLNRYGSMEAYVADKRVIYQGQDSRDVTVAGSDSWGQSFLVETGGRPLVYAEDPLPPDTAGGWLTGPDGPALARLPGGELAELVPAAVLTPGYHQKKNLLATALALLDLGLPAGHICRSMGTFPGIEHRLEFFRESRGVRFYNDTTATIPEAAAAALAAFDRSLILVCGGTDKNLDFGPLAAAIRQARSEGRLKDLVVLAGTGSDKLKALLDKDGVPFRGPWDSVDAAVRSTLDAAAAGDTVVLSPGCASFGMFLNEFDRGYKWKEAVSRLA